MDFYQFCDKINGRMYEDGVPPPTKYNFLDYLKDSSINQERGNNWQLTPLTQDDMKTTSRDDAAEWYARHGINTTKLGDPLDDEGMKRYMGL